MGNILSDIVDDINIKPSKSKLIIKWVISIATSLIVIAFVFGQFKSSFFNRMDKIETAINENTKAIINFNTEMNSGFEIVDTKISKIYDDGLIIFDEFQVYNNKQLSLIIDYGSSNKELLKKMLELNTIEKKRNLENNVEKVKKETIRPIINTVKPKNYISLIEIVDDATNDTIFYLSGAKKEYINKINRKKYIVGAIIENSNYPGLYDVNYQNK